MKKIALSLLSLVLATTINSCYAANNSCEQATSKLNELSNEVICAIITSVEKSNNLEESIENFFDLRFINQKFNCLVKDKFVQNLFIANCINKFGRQYFQELFDKLAKNFNKNLSKIKFLLKTINLVKKNLKDKKYFLDIDNKNVSKAFMKSVRDRDIELAEILISSGAHKNIYRKDHIKVTYGARALVVACARGYTKIAELLIKADVDANCQDNHGCHPLKSACFKGNAQIVELLLKSGASANTKDVTYDITVLMDACLEGDAEIVDLLIKYDADVNARASYGSTALLNACFKDCAEIVDLLIKAHANIDVQDHRGGYTPLMNACLKGYTKIVKLLMVAGANISIRNTDNKTALDLSQNEEIKEILRRRMAINKYLLEDKNKK